MSENPLPSRLPPELLEGLPAHTRWMYETIDRMERGQETINRELMALTDRQSNAERRAIRLERDVSDLKQSRLVFRSKWQVVGLLFAAGLWPIFIAALGSILPLVLK